MKRTGIQQFTAERNGFCGVWYPHPEGSTKGMIMMLGDSSDDRMATCGARWLHENGCSVMAMSPAKKDYGHHSYPLERFGMAIGFMKAHGCEKIGITGASTTGMLALAAASFYPEITLTVALSPSDFIMEAFYRDGKDGMRERPGDHESSLTWQGKQLPYLPYAYRHPEYWQMIRKESKEGGNMVASRELFDESERRHPLQEEEKIKVEKIRGKVIFIGAEDDVLWDTCRYIRRMEERLAEKPHESTCESWLFEHGTHFVFPESMLKMMIPAGSSLLVSLMFKAGREFPEECRKTRQEIDIRLRQALKQW
ncbi:MAG: acyl-CoA thioester hydrolase [Solobacterium sp.]|nr:acyl-CoA thioester hydrolase [Solobacterium sp.]